MKIRNLRRDQRGVAPLVIVLAVVLVAAVAGGGYYVMQKNKDSKSNANMSAEDKAASAAISAACEKEVGDKDFCKYASNMSALYSYNEAYTSVTTGSYGDTQMNSTTKSDGKGNVHITTVTADGTSESITLNGTTYTKASNQTVWYRIPSSNPTEDTNANDEPAFDFDEPDTSGPKTIYKNLGTEACGDLTCIKYQTYSEDSPSDTWTVWFDTKDYKTRKMEIASDGFTSTNVFTYGPVTISEPSPVEDMPDYNNMSAEELQRQMQQYMNN